MNAILRWCFAVVAIAGLSTSTALAEKPLSGVLIVEDSANLFNRDAISKARDEFAKVKSTHERQVHVVTMSKLPAEDAERFGKIEKDNKKAAHEFWLDFTKREAKDERAKGIFILICKKPPHFEIVADTAMRDRGFNEEKEGRIKDILLKSLKSAKEKDDEGKADEATAIRDKGLIEAMTVLHNLVPVSTDNHQTKTNNHSQTKSEGMGIGGWIWICIGLAVLLGLWLVVGLIRAFSGGGGGGGGGPGGGYGGGGGGGGGFFTGLLGGLFGSMAGMWLYNNMFGGSTSSAFGSDSYTSDTSGGTEAGTGDFSGDDGSGGDFDGGSNGGDSGGGDWGGGDSGGGGGDWGGGGGDAGGGGGDWGGGGGGDF